MDLVLQSNSDGAVSIWKMDGTTKTSEIDIEDPIPGIEWIVVGCGDFDGDGCDDIVFQRGTDIGMWLMDGTSPRLLADGDPGFENQDPETLIITIGTGTFAAVINHEGENSDIVVMIEGDPVIWIWTMDASGKIDEEALTSLGEGWNAIGTGDFGNDRGILCRHLTGGTVAVIEGDDSDVYFAGPNPGVLHCRIGGVGDFDGDGKADIAWEVTVGDNKLLMIWFIRSDVRYSKFVGDPQATSMKIACVADFNDDGKADLVWDNNGNVIIWTMDGENVGGVFNLGVHE